MRKNVIERTSQAAVINSGASISDGYKSHYIFSVFPAFGVENLGNAVIDVQLKEQIIQNTVLASQMTELQNERKALDKELQVLAQQYADSRLEYQDLFMSNTELKNEVGIFIHVYMI